MPEAVVPIPAEHPSAELPPPAPDPAPPVPAARFESPPPADMPARTDGDDARTRLHQLARELIRVRNRRVLVEYLHLRRALR